MSWLDKRKDVGTGDFGGDPVPAGDYVVEIVKAELLPNKQKSGRVLHLDHVIISDFHNGRHVFERWNVENPNPTAERIGLERVNQIIEFGGLEGEPADEQALVGLMVGVKIKVTNDEGYEPGNEVSFYKNPQSCDLKDHELVIPAKKGGGGGSAPPAESFKDRAAGGAAAPAEDAAPKADAPAKKPWEK